MHWTAQQHQKAWKTKKTTKVNDNTDVKKNNFLSNEIKNELKEVMASLSKSTIMRHLHEWKYRRLITRSKTPNYTSELWSVHTMLSAQIQPKCKWIMTQSNLRKQPKSFSFTGKGIRDSSMTKSVTLFQPNRAFQLLNTKTESPTNKQQWKVVVVKAEPSQGRKHCIWWCPWVLDSKQLLTAKEFHESIKKIFKITLVWLIVFKKLM